MHKFIYGWAYTGGLIIGMVRVLVNWWAYTWGAYIRGGLYSEVYGISVFLFLYFAL